MESANKRRISVSACCFCLQIAQPAYNLRTAPTVADSGTSQFYYTYILIFVCGCNKLCSGFTEYYFELYILKTICFKNGGQKRSKKVENVVDSAKNLVSTCCEICVKFTSFAVWLPNGIFWKLKLHWTNSRETQKLVKSKLLLKFKPLNLKLKIRCLCNR